MTNQNTLTTKDGLALFWRVWNTPPQYKSPRGTILLVHGFGEHCSRYGHVARFFNEKGFTVVGFDHRGHGQSEGKRGHTPNVENYFDDVILMLDLVKNNFGTQNIVIWGHSMGGNIVLNTVLRRKPAHLKAVVVTGAWVRLAFEPKPFMITLGKMMRSIYPSFSQSGGLNVQHICTDKRVVEAYKADPLVHGSITAAAGMGLTEAAAWLDAFEGEVGYPLLMMHGEKDYIISPIAAQNFAQRAKGNITFKLWDGLYHEIHNEQNYPEILNFGLQFLDKNL